MRVSTKYAYQPERLSCKSCFRWLKPGRRSHLKKEDSISYKAILAMTAAVLIAAGAGFGLKYWMDRKAGQLSSIVSITQIKAIAQLATIEYHGSTTETYERKEIPWYEWKREKLVLFLKGVVTGSVDLEAADIKIPSDPRDKHITITFKRNAIIISQPAVGRGDMKYLLLKNPNLFHRLNEKEYELAQGDAIEKLRKAALDDGIEQKTADRAKLVLSGFLKSVGYESTITFDGLDSK